MRFYVENDVRKWKLRLLLMNVEKIETTPFENIFPSFTKNQPEPFSKTPYFKALTIHFKKYLAVVYLLLNFYKIEILNINFFTIISEKKKNT